MYRPPLSSLAPYLYESWYSDIDYAYAYQWFRSHTPITSGGCSTVRKGNLIGRNLDWIYSESAEFIVHTDGVVGVANAIPGLTDVFVKSGADDEIYKIVPFMLSDGMNKHGLMVSTLVVPTDKGDNSVVRPLGTSAHMMCTLMLPRYMLDHFRTALGAMTYFKDSITLYHPKTLQDQHYDQHFIIADAVNTLCMEFVDGRYNVTNINHKPFVTNFHLTGVEFNADGSVNTPASGKASDNKITPNGSGLERYNLINSYTGSVEPLMRELSYTRAYQSSTNPAVPRWDTEFVGNSLTVDSPTSEFDYIQSEAARVYTNRSRILGDTWQTVHSAIYDVQEKKLRIYAQENFDTHWEVSVMADQTHVQHLRGDSAKNDAFTGSAGELTVDMEVKTIRMHDGIKVGGYPLVSTISNQSIDGTKTFVASPLVPTADAGDNSTKAASTAFVKGAVATAIGEASQNYVKTTGDETVAGAKTFSSSPLLPTPAVADSTKKAATTEFVMGALSGTYVGNTRTILTTSGTYTVPVTGWYKITCIGGGGGGAGGKTSTGTTTTYCCSGGGGGAGGITTGYLYYSKGQTVNYTIGAGGSGGVGVVVPSETKGTDGGNTIFGTLVAGGGSGSVEQYAAQGGTSQSGTPGQAGSAGVFCNVVNVSSEGGNGGGFGGGAIVKKDTYVAANRNGFGYGAGGAGGAARMGSSPGPRREAGGNGYQGCIIVEYYDPAKAA